MYRYDEFDERFVNERVAQFRRQVKRRLGGELTEDQFRPLRLMNGLYLQLHAYMLRINVPYGTLSSKQMRKFAYIARTYDKNFGHFTTRQNIQYNWIKLEETPDILQHLADVEVTGIQSSGNCVRNITSDQYAGRAQGRAGRSARLLRAAAPVLVPAPRVLVPAAQVQDRRDGLAERPRGRGRARHRPAHAQERAGRDRVRGARRRRPRPHAVHRPDDPQVARAGAPAVVRRVDPARLQHAGPARQHPQGAHQDHRQPDGHRQVSRARRQGMGAHEERRAEGPRRGGRAHQRLFRAAAVREARGSDRGARQAARRRPRVRSLDARQRRRAQGAGLRDRQPVAEGARQGARRHHGRQDGRRRRSRGPLQLRRDPRDATGRTSCSSTSSSPSCYELWQKLVGARARDAEPGAAVRHHLLPGARLLRARERALDPDRAGHQPRVHGPGRAAEDRPVHDQHLGLHERLRPPPRRATSAFSASTSAARSSSSSRSAARRIRTRRSATGSVPGCRRPRCRRRFARSSTRISSFGSRTSASSIPIGASASSRSRAPSTAKKARPPNGADQER